MLYSMPHSGVHFKQIYYLLVEIHLNKPLVAYKLHLAVASICLEVIKPAYTAQQWERLQSRGHILGSLPSINQH